jgi:hypothetical protein
MTSVKERVELAVSDRCDKCTAQAKVRATLVSGALYFCGHHAREAGSALVLKSIEVYDPEGVFNYGKQ